MGKDRGKGKSSEQLRATARDKIRVAGLRSTPARVATLLALEQSDSPLTHAEVADKIQELGVDKATVLRNLVDLVAAGLARRTELGDRLWRYESADPAQPLEAHPHFLCVDCGSVTCLGDLELTPSSRRQSEVVGKVTEILLKGHCQSCNEVQPIRG